MLTPQLIPTDSITPKLITSMPATAPNYFGILKTSWPSKPRLDIVLTKDGTPIVLTKVAINSGLGIDQFKLRYKEQETDPIWKDYLDAAGNKVHRSQS